MMKNISFQFFSALNLILIIVGAHTVFAKAPATAKIAFASNRDGNWEIYLMNPDGSQQERLTRNNALDHSPVWSPTGEQILFTSDRDGIKDLYVMDADGGRVRRVFAKLAVRIEPTWLPDGERIAFHAETPRWSIQTATINGEDVKQVASAESHGGNPSWSANGNEIAFVKGAGGTYRIFIVKLDSGDIRTFLPKESALMHTPSWSPKGDKLAFTWSKWGLRNKSAIFVANRDGSHLRQISERVPLAYYPAWSPDGDKIVYVEEAVERNRQIAVVDVETGGKTQLTHRGWNITPSWFDPKSLSVSPQPHLLTTTWGRIKTN